MNITRWRQAVVLLLFAMIPQTARGEPADTPAATSPAAGPANSDHVLDRRIDKALKRGVDYLLAKKKTDNWETIDRFGGQDVSGSETALVLDALFQVAHSIDDLRLRPNAPELAGAIDWLARRESRGAFAASLKALALCHLPLTTELKPAALRAREVLLACVRPDGSVAAMAAESGGHTAATSASESWDAATVFQTYAALAALDDCGLEVPPEIWKAGDQWLRREQLPDGAWPVSSRESGSAAAEDAAGVAAWQGIASRSEFAGSAARATTRDAAMEGAFHKLEAEFGTQRRDRRGYFYLDALQRAARACGARELSGKDWYREIARQLLAAQLPDGSWPAAGGDAFGDSDAAARTAYALRFLARGRDPAMFAKFRYGGRDSHWDAMPNDVANLTEWLSHDLDKPLNWQVLSLDSAAADWAASPILVITGSGDPHFSTAEAARLRSFVERGGLIFSSADGADRTFTDSIENRYVPALVDGRYKMRALSEESVVFGPDLYAKIADAPPLMGLSNGVRELWIHSPGDMAAAWQARRFSARNPLFLPANLLRYVSGNGSLRNVLQSPPAPSLPAGKVKTDGTIELARLDYAGNADPEPAAWPRLAALAPARFHFAVRITTVKVGDLDATKTPVAHMTGTDSFKLAEPEIATLKKFLDSGGTLLADSAGASPAFTASFKDLMSKLYPNETPAELPVNDPVFNGSIKDSVRLAEVEYRKYAILKMNGEPVKPRILAVTISARHVILFSPEDITSGLLGTDTWGIQGYTPASAADLARNLLVYTTMK